jgi:hypothetical protein
MSDNPALPTKNKEEIRARLEKNLTKLGIDPNKFLTIGGSKRRLKTYRAKLRRGTRRLLK